MTPKVEYLVRSGLCDLIESLASSIDGVARFVYSTSESDTHITVYLEDANFKNQFSIEIQLSMVDTYKNIFQHQDVIRGIVKNKLKGLTQ